jgi:hypothetical protein
MTSLLTRWAALVAATALTWWLGESGRLQGHHPGALALVLALAFVKGRWIILDFMALRHGPPLWRRLLLGWLTGVLAFIGAAWWWTAQTSA